MLDKLLEGFGLSRKSDVEVACPSCKEIHKISNLGHKGLADWVCPITKEQLLIVKMGQSVSLIRK